MSKCCLNNSLVGKRFPFFLNNFNFNEYFLYELYSPKLNDDCVPYFSLKMIIEKTFKKSSSTILNTVLPEKADWEELDKALSKFKPTMKDSENASEPFPFFLMKDTGVLQKTLILWLRDALRWKKYKFYVGNKIDVLISPTEYAVLTICGDQQNNIWLEVENAYSTEDVTMSNPLDIDLSNLVNQVSSEKWKRSGSASELNKFIRRLESTAFDSLIKE